MNTMYPSDKPINHQSRSVSYHGHFPIKPSRSIIFSMEHCRRWFLGFIVVTFFWHWESAQPQVPELFKNRGIGPKSWLCERFNTSRDVKLLISLGIYPTNLFEGTREVWEFKFYHIPEWWLNLAYKIVVRQVEPSGELSFPIISGIYPSNMLLDQAMKVKTVRILSVISFHSKNCWIIFSQIYLHHKFYFVIYKHHTFKF